MRRGILFVFGFLLSSTCFANLINGGSGGGGAAGSGTISAGTSGQVPQYTAGTTIGPSNFYQNSDGSFGLSGSTFAAITSTFSTIQVSVSSPVPVNVVTFSTFSSLPDCLQVVVDSQTSVSPGVASLPETIYSLAANSTYYIEASLVYQSAAATTGLVVAWDVPNDSTMTFTTGMPTSNTDGTAAMFWGTAVLDTEQVINANTPVASTSYEAKIWGHVYTITAGSFVQQYGTEVNGSVVKIKAGSRVCFSKQR